MKRALILISLLGVACLVTYLLMSKKHTAPDTEPKPAALSVSGTAGPFDHNFSFVLTDYFTLQQAFVNWDSAGIRKGADGLAAALDTLNFAKLKADSSIVMTAVNLSESMQGELKGLGGETNIQEMRKSFNMLTDELYNLIRTVRFDGSTVYHMRCPMAFGDSLEGFWLSGTREIVNPYLGNKHPVYKAKMMGCGEIIDSIQYVSSAK